MTDHRDELDPRRMRDEIIEECAKLVEGYYGEESHDKYDEGFRIAAAIRALKEKP